MKIINKYSHKLSSTQSHINFLLPMQPLQIINHLHFELNKPIRFKLKLYREAIKFIPKRRSLGESLSERRFQSPATYLRKIFL